LGSCSSRATQRAHRRDDYRGGARSAAAADRDRLYTHHPDVRVPGSAPALAIPRIIADVLIAAVLVVFGIIRMKVVGVNLAGIITTSAVITGVIAFSLQETLGNLWGGVALQLDNTCRIGDWIRMEARRGRWSESAGVIRRSRPTWARRSSFPTAS
jgi:small-conductance mechanosensitive channel